MGILEEQSSGGTEFIPFGDRPFFFECRKDLLCFNECCAKLRLVLTPYDIVRIKNRLNIPSWRFLDEYTETLASNHNRFPMVQLRMGEGKGQVCPFVTSGGCAIYEDRPVACRMYPLGRASRHMGARQPGSENFFIVKEPHCRGFEEKRTWDLSGWLEDQRVEEYDAMNRPWMEIVTSSQKISSKIPREALSQVFFTASYDLDKFRKLIFQSKFFDRFTVETSRRKQMETKDAALMTFGFIWLKFSLFGEMNPELQISS